MNFFVTLGKNDVFLAALFSWLLAQTIKVVIGVIRKRRFNFKWFVGAGGMPSSHAATVSSLATSIGLIFGFSSAFFAVTFFFAFIIMFDAQGVRRQSGRQAGVLNKIIEDIYLQRKTYGVIRTYAYTGIYRRSHRYFGSAFYQWLGGNSE